MSLDTALAKKAQHRPDKGSFLRSVKGVSLGCTVFALIGAGVVFYSKLHEYDAMSWWYLAEVIGITFVFWLGSIQLRRYAHRKLPSRSLSFADQLWRLRLQLVMSWIETCVFLFIFYLIFIVAEAAPEIWMKVPVYTIVAILFVSLPSVGQLDRTRISKRMASVQALRA